MMFLSATRRRYIPALGVTASADFVDRVKVLSGKLIKKGYIKPALNSTFRRCLHKHPWIERKYDRTVLNDIF